MCVFLFEQPVELRATDACAIAVGDPDVNTVIEVDGYNFGVNSTFLAVNLTSSLGFVKARL